MEQPPRRPADFVTVHRDICKETQNLSVQLRALLKSPSKWRYTNLHIHSFIHSTSQNVYAGEINGVVRLSYSRYWQCAPPEIWLLQYNWNARFEHFVGMSSCNTGDSGLKKVRRVKDDVARYYFVTRNYKSRNMAKTFELMQIEKNNYDSLSMDPFSGSCLL